MIWFIIFGAVVLLFGFVVFFGAPYVPSQTRFVKRAFDSLYVLGPQDTLVDIGSGDGLVLRQAALRGAAAIGYEINPLLVVTSRVLSMRYPRIRIMMQNFWRAQLPDETTVVYAFSVSRDSRRLESKLQREADRIGRSFSLLCFGPPLKQRTAIRTFEAYSLYRFHPLQVKTLAV